MKRFFTLLMAAVSLMACSRTYEERVELPGEFTATIESIGTKTSMDGIHVLWSSGDQVSVFAGMAINECYQVTKASAGKRSANFTKVGNSEGFGSTIPANVAYYPYASDVEVDWSASEALVYATLPATQTYAAASFGQGVYPMMAVTQGTTDKDFAFKNICGVLKLQLTGIQKVKSIAFQGNDNEVICGDAIITSSYGSTPSIQMTGNGKALTLDCGEGVQLTDTPTEFCIVLPPMTFSKGFTVTVTDTDSKSMEIVTSKPQTISRADILKMPAKEFVGVPEANEPTGELCFTAEEAGSTVSLNKYGTPYDVPQEYCVDGENWHEYTFGTPITLANVGDKVYFRKMTEGVAEGFSWTSLQGNYYFEMSGLIAASGNVMSLIDKTCQSVAIPSRNCFRGLFEYCSSLTQAPELPAATLAIACYFHMFANCTSLTEAPELPATTLTNNCYTGMFMGCTSLTEAPELPATTLKSYCYADMFQGCTSLADAPELPATELADGCYHGMFGVCTSLTKAPVLPAKTLKDSCYAEMFADCTALAQAPELPATSLALQCYESMFGGCTSLTEAPELPATTLDYFCYNCMFQGCTSLTKAPELPATTLVEGCYRSMFQYCSSLNEVKCYATDISANNATKEWLSGVASTGTFYAAPAASWSRGDSGIPVGWNIKTTENGYEYVDLGLSVKWATMNVGATKPEDYGDYFAWGATEPWYEPGYAEEDPQQHWKSGHSDGYTWKNAPYQTVNTTDYETTKFTKYLGSTTSSFKDASAIDADALKIVLAPEDDAAHVNWGGSWRMPTIMEWNELKSLCTWTWVVLGGKQGYRIQSNKSGYTDRWIFLPYASARYSDYLERGGYSFYWSSSLRSDLPCEVYGLVFAPSTFFLSGDERCSGHSVRAVIN